MRTFADMKDIKQFSYDDDVTPPPMQGGDWVDMPSSPAHCSGEEPMVYTQDTFD